jgi:hypothetical protein
MIYQIKISLKDSKPLIWRRVLVPSNYTIAQLHDIIQVSMGWTDSHFHAFKIQNQEYSKKYENFHDEEDESLDAKKFKIEKLLKKKSKINYTYDFGDCWEHIIEVEDILKESEFKPPFCVKAVGNCPIEDSGGLWGYYEKLAILDDPKNPEYEEIKEWMGDDYNAAINLKDINSSLAKIK